MSCICVWGCLATAFPEQLAALQLSLNVLHILEETQDQSAATREWLAIQKIIKLLDNLVTHHHSHFNKHPRCRAQWRHCR